MRLVAVMLAAGMLAGCQTVEAGAAISNGELRFEPHPVHADSVRLLTIVSPLALDPLRRGTPEGNRRVVRALLGEECADAPIIEEGRMTLRMGGRREYAALRVICPAARL